MLPSENGIEKDSIAHAFKVYAQNILVVLFGISPIFFIPSIVAPFEYTKVGILFLGMVVCAILYSLSVLRSGTFSFSLSYALVALWIVAGISLLSAIFSGDLMDSLIGDLFSIHSAAFVTFLACVTTFWTFMRIEQKSMMRLYMLLAVSSVLLLAFHAVRLVFGYEALTFTVFNNATFSPVGSWNDLALFLGLIVLMSLIAFEQLPSRRWIRMLCALLTVSALAVLCVINFLMVWVVLGVASLVHIVYTLGKDRFTAGQLPLEPRRPYNTTSLLIALIVFTTSVVFLLGGATVGGFLAKYTGVSYVEVRPSFEATADITQAVYKDNLLLGVGPNKFADAWRLHRDTAINQTQFWNVDFNAGNGYITTFFATSGVIGGSVWILFVLVFLVTGIRRLLTATTQHKWWYFVAFSSFVAALYVWLMSLVYVPGVVILIVGALMTGVSLHAFQIISGKNPREISLGNDRRTGFVLIFGVIASIVSVVSLLYIVARHYVGVYTFSQSVYTMQHDGKVEDLEKMVERAYQLSSSDVFARRIAEYQVGRLSTILSRTTPLTEIDQLTIEQAKEVGLNAAQEAIRIDGNEPANWEVLGNLYSVLAAQRTQGAYERAVEAYNKTRELNPKNPLVYLELGIVEARAGNVDVAREHIERAISMRPNFTEAFFLLSQLEIATGNVDRAIESTQATIVLEPNNPARYYQLGVLESSRNNIDTAILAFERAIQIDQNFANARYLLALAYDEKGRSQDARDQLAVVLSLNPDNAEVKNMIASIDTQGSLRALRGNAQAAVNEAIPTTDENGTVSTEQEVDTPLVNTVNTPPKSEVEEE
jgi:tetratricopeptide (TPR) repeat protein